MKIDQHRATNPLWHELREYYRARLEQLRIENDNPNLDPEATAAMRARISEIKMFLAMEADPIDIKVASM